MIDSGFVNGGDGGFRVGVSGQQNAFCFRVNFDRLLQKFDARHSRHSLVNQKKRDRIVSDFQFADNIERRLPGIGAQNAVIGRSIFAANRARPPAELPRRHQPL
jgi:hypothetical protein